MSRASISVSSRTSAGRSAAPAARERELGAGGRTSPARGAAASSRRPIDLRGNARERDDRAELASAAGERERRDVVLDAVVVRGERRGAKEVDGAVGLTRPPHASAGAGEQRERSDAAVTTSSVRRSIGTPRSTPRGGETAVRRPRDGEGSEMSRTDAPISGEVSRWRRRAGTPVAPGRRSAPDRRGSPISSRACPSRPAPLRPRLVRREIALAQRRVGGREVSEACWRSAAICSSIGPPAAAGPRRLGRRDGLADRVGKRLAQRGPEPDLRPVHDQDALELRDRVLLLACT